MDISKGAGYGDTLVWTEATHPGLGEREVEIQETVDKAEVLLRIRRPAHAPHTSASAESGALARLPACRLTRRNLVANLHSQKERDVHATYVFVRTD